jgi:adenylate cyclase
VNLAARVAGLAKVGQIVTTEETFKLLSPELAQRARKLIRVQVKGKQAPVTIFEFMWRDSEDITALSTLTDHGPAVHLVIKYESREWHFEGPGELSIGRGDDCDIVVGDRKASRRHARVERRRNNFVLVDQSSNGTWVQVSGEAEATVLQREEIILRATGVIGLGHSPADGQGTPLAFICK